MRCVALVLGTRPEVVKLDGIRRLLGDAARVVHTGQHFDRGMAGDFYRELGWPEPDVQLRVGGQSRGQQIGMAVRLLDESLRNLIPDAVVVQGDTNAVLAGALAANALELPLVHVEAGLRSHDRAMPEEHNRIVVDHLADLCLAPTPLSQVNLLAEGIPLDRIAVTGNTVIEGVERYLPSEDKRKKNIQNLGMDSADYVLVTIHRPENTSPAGISSLIDIMSATPRTFLWPMHPRVRNYWDGRASVPDNIRVIPPLRYTVFLSVLAESAYALTDSGGIQEEVTVLGVPTVVVRRSSERPEALGTFCRLVSLDDLQEELFSLENDLEGWRTRLRGIPSPFGDGSASVRSVAAITELIGRQS